MEMRLWVSVIQVVTAVLEPPEFDPLRREH